MKTRSIRMATVMLALLCSAAGTPALAQSEQVPSPDAPAAAPAAGPAQSQGVGGRTNATTSFDYTDGSMTLNGSPLPFGFQ